MFWRQILTQITFTNCKSFRSKMLSFLIYSDRSCLADHFNTKKWTIWIKMNDSQSILLFGCYEAASIGWPLHCPVVAIWPYSKRSYLSSHSSSRKSEYRFGINDQNLVYSIVKMKQIGPFQEMFMFWLSFLAQIVFTKYKTLTILTLCFIYIIR